jgi:3-oxoacyl-[acyl-carrier-protein] synthase-3
MRNVIIKGTGSYLPERIIKNDYFMDWVFYTPDKNRIDKDNHQIVEKLTEISGISERRFLEPEMVSSDMAAKAGALAIENADIDPETLDYIVVAHNVGDVQHNNPKKDIIPSIAARVKAKIGIKNPNTVAYDIIFGCPGWVEAMIQVSYFLKSGDAKRALIIGSESLSRVLDPHDRDSMLYADGAGATILEAVEADEKFGVLAHKSRSDATDYWHLLTMGPTYNPENNNKDLFIKMNGRKLYEYAVTNVPPLVKDTIIKAGLDIKDINKVLIHQANDKMDEAIVTRVYRQFGIRKMPEGAMPMIIQKMGNNSVGTIPIMLDKILRGQLDGHQIQPDDHIIFTSVGAGMNINAVAYKFPT